MQSDAGWVPRCVLTLALFRVFLGSQQQVPPACFKVTSLRYSPYDSSEHAEVEVPFVLCAEM